MNDGDLDGSALKAALEERQRRKAATEIVDVTIEKQLWPRPGDKTRANHNYWVLEGRNNLTGAKEKIQLKNETRPFLHERVYLTGLREQGQYGMQFVAHKAELVPDDVAPAFDRAQMVGYLRKANLPWIDTELAEAIADEFQGEAWDIIENQPARLDVIPRLQQRSILALEDPEGKNQALKDRIRLHKFLYNVNMEQHVYGRVMRSLGFSAQEAILEDPYVLCQNVRGVAFNTSDRIAKAMGLPFDSQQRIRAAVNDQLNHLLSDGACGANYDDLLARTEKVLRRGTDRVDFDSIRAVIYEMWRGDNLHPEFDPEAPRRLPDVALRYQGDTPVVFRPQFLRLEERIAQFVMERAGRKPGIGPVNVQAELARYEEGSDFRLATAQRQAVGEMLTSPMMIMTGGPGVGKTSTLSAALAILQSLNLKAVLCAPTGVAAKRMLRATGHEASTIHRALGFDREKGGWRHDKDNPIEADFVFCDEYSMVDIYIAASLFDAIGPRTTLVMVGDKDQLLSVGAGRVLGDLIASKKIPVVHLTEIFRQQKGSMITAAAHEINAGRMPVVAPKGAGLAEANFHFFERDDSGRIQDDIVRLVTEILPQKYGFDPARDIQLIAPMKMGEVGVFKLNQVIRERVNPLAREEGRRFNVGQTEEGDNLILGVGDKVMQTLNRIDLGIVNGDIGFVTAVNTRGDFIKVDFDGFEVTLDRADCRDLQLAYCMTVHKAQGSEAKIVIMPLVDEHRRMHERNLIYTGITRAREQCILLGKKSLLEDAVKRIGNQERLTWLGEALRRADDAEYAMVQDARLARINDDPEDDPADREVDMSSIQWDDEGDDFDDGPRRLGSGWD